MFEVYDMDFVSREFALADKEYEVGMMEVAYMEMLLDNKLTLNKARAELKVMTESSKEYAIGDLIYMYNEAAKEVSAQAENIFARAWKTAVGWFVKIWNTIQKVFTGKNTEAYEKLKSENKTFKFPFNPRKLAESSKKIADGISQIPDNIDGNADTESTFSKILTGAAIVAAGGTAGVGAIKLIKGFNPKDEETEVKGGEAPGILGTLSESFHKITAKIQKLKLNSKSDATNGTPDGQNPSGDNGSNPKSGDDGPKKGKSIVEFITEAGNKIKSWLEMIGQKFGITGGQSDVNEDNGEGDNEGNGTQNPDDQPDDEKPDDGDENNDDGTNPQGGGNNGGNTSGGNSKKDITRSDLESIISKIKDKNNYKGFINNGADRNKLQVALQVASNAISSGNDTPKTIKDAFNKLNSTISALTHNNIKIDYLDEENGYCVQRKDKKKGWVKESFEDFDDNFTDDDINFLNNL